MPTHPIILNGRPSHITENLASALYHLRPATESDKVPFFWVDVMCINQADLAEKSVQIGRMRLIYESAAAVLCWLGPRVGDMSTVCRKLTDSFALLPQDKVGKMPSISPLAQYTPIIHPHLSEQDWLALSRFFANPWWYRVW